MYAEVTKDSRVVPEGSPSGAAFSVALCVDQPDLAWFPDEEPDTAPAELKALCAQCPLQAKCLADAVAFEASGIWAGTTTRERQLLYGLTIHPGKPGNRSWYRAGCRCSECRADQAARVRAQRQARRERNA